MLHSLIICASKIKPDILPTYYTKLDSFLELKSHSFANKLFSEKLEDIKIVTLQSLALIVEKCPTQLRVLDSVKCAITYWRHNVQLLKTALELLETASYSKVQDIPNSEYCELKAQISDLVLDTNSIMVTKQKESESGKPLSKRSSEASSAQNLQQILPSIQDPSPEKMVNILEKLIYEYSKGYPPTSLYHIDVLAILQMHKVLGSFLIQPEIHQCSYLPSQQAHTSTGQIILKSFSNLRAFMAFAFILDNRVNPNYHTFSLRFVELSPFLEAMTAIVLQARPNTIITNSMNWMISKFRPENQTTVHPLVRTLCLDAIEKYFSLCLVDDSRMLDSRLRIIGQMLQIVLGSEVNSLPVKVDHVIDKTLRQKKDWPQLTRELSHEHLEIERIAQPVSRAQIDSSFEVGDNKTSGDISMLEQVDVKLISDINNFDKKSRDASETKDTDMRIQIIKTYMPFPDYSVLPNIRKIAFRLVSILQDKPIPVITRQPSASQNKQKKNKLTTKLLADKFLELIHRTDTQSISQSNLKSGEQKESKSSLEPRSLKSLNVDDSARVKTSMDNQPSTILNKNPTESKAKINTNFEFNSNNHKNVSLPMVNGRIRQANKETRKFITRSNSREMTSKHRISSHEKPKLQVFPPVKNPKYPKEKKELSVEESPKGFFVKIKVDKAVPVNLPRRAVESSYTRDQLYCKIRSQWLESDEMLMQAIHRSIREESEYVTAMHWNAILKKEAPGNICADKVQKTMTNMSIVKTLFQVG